MPSFNRLSDSPKKGRIIKSAYDGESFESDGSIHVEGLVGSATISPSGRDIALASPEGLAIIDLDSPYNPPRRLRSHGMPWLVCEVQWSPFAARDYWVVSTANHRALVWNLNLREDSTSGAIEHSLQGHSRAITDVNFSAHHPDLLATCSVDGYVHWWDLRRPRQPVLTFCDWFAGATQVKFNRQDPHILASAHDRWLHVSDERRACEPLKSISAHTSKIYGIDWNRTRPTGIVTCSLDKTIRFWDYGKDDDMLEHVVRTDFPVWRARHTPFGWGLLAMPQNEPGDLYLYDRLWTEDSPVEVTPEPVAVFPGHGDHKAKEFLWRSRGSISDDNIDHREFPLVSWGTDNELRLHCVDNNVLSSVGHTKDGPARKGLSLTRQGAVYKTFRTVDDSANRDRRAGTMSDNRSGTTTPHHHHKQSTLTLGMRSGAMSRQMRPAWRGPSMKAKVGSSKRVDRSQAQLGWMKGITMTKRKPSTDGSRRRASRDTGIVGHDYADDEWGQPDTIQEELLRVSTQIPKVKWENIDMDNLTLNASLTGPWGVDGEPIFIKVKIDIPADYPKLRAPKFLIEKTSFMPEDNHKRIVRELHQLADQFLQRKQNCLEVAFTYLLGEVDLETSTTFFKNGRDLDDELDGLADESSSEDDEDNPTSGSVSMSQELTHHGEIDTMLAPSNRNIIPPSPRTCGARFSNDGRLVCFFPSKEEKARALFSTSAELYSKERAKGEPFFAGFGRLAYDVPSRHKYATDEASATDDQSDSSDSDVSSSSSSDSESTSMHKMSLWYRPSRQVRKTWSEDRSVRSSGGGTGAGTGTGTGTGTGRRRFGRPRNLVSIHDLRAELPSKREFAEEYAIFGDGGDVCEHNARVAEKYGSDDLVDVWRYLALLLNKGIPLEVLGRDLRRCSILVIARDTVLRCRDDASGNDRSLLGRVKWGRHPLAREFIMDLFEHFEKLADVQMLAMLSCIFNEPSTNDGVAYVESQLRDQETPLPIKAPSFSLDYFPTDASAWGVYSRSHTNSAATTPGTLHTPIHYAGSPPDELMWPGEPGTGSYSCGETPPTKGKGFLADQEQPSPMSRSPSNRGILRGNTGLASAFAANLPRSFTGGSSSSPPTQGKKRPSPAEYIMNSLAPSTGNTTQGSSSAMADSGGGRTSISDDDYRRDDMLPLVPVNVAVVLEDQTIFDDDGWLSTPLLDSSRASVHANYRYVYAEMLQMWGQPLARLEVMKFNVLKEHFPLSGMPEGSFHDSVTIHDGASGTGAHPKTGSSPIVMGRKDQLHALLASGRGLDVTGICRVHETQLEPARYTTSEPHLGGAVGKCDRCQRSQTQLRCVYCLEPVDALFPTCLSCGCASHESCLAEWHAAGETLCPGGDECNCVEESSNGQVESWAALQGAMLKGPNKMAMLPSGAVEGSDEEHDGGRRGGWERVEKKVPSPVQGASAAPSPSAASLSFGRLKKSAGTWSRTPSSMRRGASRREG
ncbi:putative RWD, RING finger and WD repeat-containing protein C11E3.05 [Tolypocladium ophioglossoides CBS 100239]|uniref:Putative RWD, RING finger and WD repeat-containing protein C11E3.05 n=1 Tax=Tolypocladium ophioglossoides (strain CBS 100239) TaxID=1163406 RepID=A0A0L0N6Y0_TOLOC|nr:putative RWD, RING finger and WD repeat-containing protein C11E3.05 [Tolypocladium ophioglossoides CBS 100239]